MLGTLAMVDDGEADWKMIVIGKPIEVLSELIQVLGIIR